jgi:hypothetical protein
MASLNNFEEKLKRFLNFSSNQVENSRFLINLMNIQEYLKQNFQIINLMTNLVKVHMVWFMELKLNSTMKSDINRNNNNISIISIFMISKISC